MKKVFVINGGAGRVICALPALQKYYKNHGPDFYILSESGIEFFVGHPELQDLAFELNHKGLFEDIIKPNDLVTIEPYREHGYYNQKKSLSQSFDKLINNTDDHSDLEKPKIVLSKMEEINALDAVSNVRDYHKKKKTIVIQPFGRSCSLHKTGHTIDPSSRSLSTDDYFYISEKIRRKYNLITFSEIKFDNDENMYVETNIRQWSAIIEAADYFVGIDSVGQHMAYAFNKPGSIILGSTFAENISYPKHFNILEKKGIKKKYSPIRIDGLDGELINRYNDTCMDFTRKELDDITNKILVDAKKKIGE
tara:strand:+ start:4397 stop:5320 length:924 start_codon:yes stop_codon:yes gene_type:complete